MKRYLTLITLVLLTVAITACPKKEPERKYVVPVVSGGAYPNPHKPVWVEGYTRKDGTTVSGHWRSGPNQGFNPKNGRVVKVRMTKEEYQQFKKDTGWDQSKGPYRGR